MDRESMATEVHDYISERYGDNYSVIREEYGEIPLSTRTKHNNEKSKHLKIGIPAGSTRAIHWLYFFKYSKTSR